MNEERTLSLAWMRTGGVCGLLGGLSYFAAAFLPLPDIAAWTLAFAFGPLLAIGAMGLYHGLALHHRGPMVQIATVFAVAGGCTVLIMITVQQAIFTLNQRAIEAATDPAVAEHYRLIGRGLNSVQLGIDVAWDVLISAAVVLFGLAMVRHPRFGRVFGALGAVLGLLLLVFNLRYFPVPPIDSDSIDWGPAVAIWLLVAFGLLLRAARKERLASAGG